MLSTFINAITQRMPDGFLSVVASGTLLLARSQKPPLMRMVWPAVLIIVLAAVLLGALSIVRRRMKQLEQPSILRGFTLNDLRQLRSEGKLTDEEFEKAKAKLVSTVQSTLKKEAKPATGTDAMSVEPKE